MQQRAHTRRPITTLLGSGIVVALTGFAAPMDGVALDPGAGAPGSAPWDGSSSLAWVVTRADAAARAATAPCQLTEGPRSEPLARPATARRWGPARVGLHLPPLVCVVDTPDPSEMLSPPGFAGAGLAGSRTQPARQDLILAPSQARPRLTDADRYRLAPKGSPPA